MKVIICGAGQVGATIAKHLASEGMDVTAIDLSSERIRLINESYDVRGIVGHASHPRILRQAGADEADMLIAVTRSDEVNMVACQVGYSLFNIGRRIARLRHVGYLADSNKGLYAAEHLPIDFIISPEVEIADGIARRLRVPGAFDMVAMGNGAIQLLGIHCNVAGCSLVGQRFGDLESHPFMSVLSVIRSGGAFIPGPDDQVELHDDLYVVAPSDAVERVMGAFGHHEMIADSIVIVGGGNIGRHLARKITTDTPSVSLKIVEAGKERAEQLAEELGTRAVVIHGDALDRDLLEEARIGTADTVVAVTNDDETNIFASVLGKQAGCKRALTLVNKNSYEPLMPLLGIDATVSPSAVTISTVLRHVRHGTISSVYTIREDFGEAIEAVVPPSSPLAGVALGNLDLPAGMKIGAVIRDGAGWVTDRNTVLQSGDHIVAIVTYKAINKAEAILAGKRTWTL